MVSSVTASCNIKQVSFFFLSSFFFLGQDNWPNNLSCFKMDVFFFFCIQIAC